MQFFRHRRERGRPPHPDVLTPAEWRVLEHVRDGLPNAEIAVRLGLSVNTVRYHVSNMLSKLGLPDREALAAWDGEPGEASRVALGRAFALPSGWLTKGTVSLGAKSAAAGTTAVLFVVALLAVYAYFADASDGAAIGSTVTGNYLEFTVESDSAPGPAATVHGKEGTVTRSTVRWWWADDDRFRIEIHSDDSLLGRYQMVLLPDGDEVINYNAISGTYQRQPMRDLPSGEIYRPPAFVHIGPVPADAATLDEFVDQVAARLGVDPEHLGTEDLLGRTVELFAVGPAGSTATTEGSPTGASAEPEPYGVRRLAIDPATRLVLLDEADGEGVGPSHRAEVTTLELDAPLEVGLFGFEPPSFVQEFGPDPQVECSVASASTPAGGLPSQPGFLRPDYLPDGWVAENRLVMGEDPRCPEGRAWVLFRSDAADGYLFFDQRRRAASDVPEWLRTDTPVDVAGHEGYRLTADGVEHLIWAQDGLIALLESDTASFDELLRMAESAALQ